ncbi:hypothetical protein [Pseudomonas nitroreducens]|uniref:hypothetical protein n=1 Tax=Pseudomonas nitroreducens TaxID=46680 RepID=UPI003D2C9DBE
MDRVTVCRVRVLEVLPLVGSTQCLRLLLEGSESEAVIPGQYCVLNDSRREPRTFDYVSLPGRDQRFIVATSQPGLSLSTLDQLSYRGPFGSGWPLPLGASRLLVFASERGILAVAAAIDEFACWMPWVRVVLIHDATSPAHLPDDCRSWLRSLGLLAEAGLDSCPVERLRDHLSKQLPDLVYCAAPAPLAQRAARLCQWYGVPAYRIWLRDERCFPSAGAWPTSNLDGPVLRFDRLNGRIRNRP